jgi:MFS family permease
LLAFAVFAIGFFASPIGGLALGVIGDRIGRRALLALSIALMGGSTLILCLLPIRVAWRLTNAQVRTSIASRS